MRTRLKGILVFAVSFLIPLFSLYLWASSANEDRDAEFLREIEFAQEVKIVNDGEFLEFTTPEALTPEPGKDFLFLTWLRLTQLPVGEERMHVFSYYDGEAEGRPGYALMIRKDADAVRPAVYWPDEKGKNRWQSFTKLPVYAKEWFFLAVTYTEDKYLGLHVGAFDRAGGFRVKTLGGYEDQPVTKVAGVPLTIGAIGTGLFKGKLGPLLVANLERTPDRITDVLSAIALSPHSVEKVTKPEERLLWVAEGTESKLPQGVHVKVHPERLKKTEQSAKKQGKKQSKNS